MDIELEQQLDPQFSAPSLALLGMEPLRAALEYAGMRFMNRKSLPTGDGHAVVVFPGLASDERAVAPLCEFCAELGYTAYDWGRGYNIGPQGEIEPWLDDLAAHVDRLTARHDEPISLIGWSLGGIYAREVAKRIASRARQVITIGSPFAGEPKQTNVAKLYRWLNGSDPVVDDALRMRLCTAPDVPTTSIYSRSDGIVAWQACVQAGNHAHVENIEVDGSHCGMGWNANVLTIVADRLAQQPKLWQRYAQRPN